METANLSLPDAGCELVLARFPEFAGAWINEVRCDYHVGRQSDLDQISSMKTSSYEFQLQRNSFDPTRSINRGVSIASPIELSRAGDFHFQEPGMKWESMDEDEILFVGKLDWGVARLQRLFQDDGVKLDRYQPTADIEAL